MRNVLELSTQNSKCSGKKTCPITFCGFCIKKKFRSVPTFNNQLYLNKPNAERSGTRHSERSGKKHVQNICVGFVLWFFSGAFRLSDRFYLNMPNADRSGTRTRNSKHCGKKTHPKFFLWFLYYNFFFLRSNFQNQLYPNKPNAKRSGTRHSELETLQKKTCSKYFCRFCIINFYWSALTFRTDFT